MCGEIIDKDVISMCASNASDKTGIYIRGSLSSVFPLLDNCLVSYLRIQPLDQIVCAHHQPAGVVLHKLAGQRRVEIFR